MEYGPSANPIADTAAISIGLALNRMPRTGPLTGDSSGVAIYTYVVDATGRHGPDSDNGVTAQAQAVILQIFNDYVREYGADGFRDDGNPSTPNNGIGFVITEASLPRGGLFDVGPEIPPGVPPWRHPHQFHRAGFDFDVRITNIPIDFQDDFIRTCVDFGAICANEGNHFHVYVDYHRRSQEGFENG